MVSLVNEKVYIQKERKKVKGQLVDTRCVDNVVRSFNEIFNVIKKKVILSKIKKNYTKKWGGGINYKWVVNNMIKRERV